MRAVPHLCEFYPNICLTTGEKARKNSSQGNWRVTVYMLHITKTPTHYKSTQTHTHTHTRPHMTKPTHTHTHTLQNPHIHTPKRYKTHTYTHPHITKQHKTTTVQIKTNTTQDIPKWISHNINKYPQYKVTLMSVPSSLAGRCTYLPMKMGQSVPKRRRIKFRRRDITQKKAYNNSTFLPAEHIRDLGSNRPLSVTMGTVTYRVAFGAQTRRNYAE